MKFPFFSRKKRENSFEKLMLDEIKRDNNRNTARQFVKNIEIITQSAAAKIDSEYTDKEMSNLKTILQRIVVSAVYDGSLVESDLHSMRKVLKIISYYADNWRILDNYELSLKLWILIIPGVNAEECISPSQYDQLKTLEFDIDIDEARVMLNDIADMFEMEKFL